MHILPPLLAAFLPFLSQASAGDVFTVNCNGLTVQRSDPIAKPGGASGHVHRVVGGTGFNRTESNQDAINAHSTTCDKLLDKSNYWDPALYHHNTGNTYTLVPLDVTAVYYLNRVCDYGAGDTNNSCDYSKYPLAPPAGLRMLAGDPMRHSYDNTDKAQQAISRVCVGNNDTTDPQLPQRWCSRMRSQVFFPSCWDGQPFDSAESDHSSHMAYPALGQHKGVYPSTHPKAIFSIFMEFIFDTSKIANNMQTKNFVYAMNDSTGYGLHGDFLNGWTNQTALQLATLSCLGDKGVDDPGCSLRLNGVLGQRQKRDPDVPAPVEDVELNEPIATLPGQTTPPTPPACKA